MGKVLMSGIVPKVVAPVTGIPAGDLAVGSSVYINVGGVPKEFLVVHRGLPSSLYDGSCDGIWLLMKEPHTTHTWFSSEKNNSYKDATIHTYLNNTFLNLLDADIQGLIQQAKIPYINGDALSVTNVSSGANGLSTKIFLLGAIEAGFTVEDNLTEYGGEMVAKDGACLDYFAGCDGSAADPKRVAYYNGAATEWWLRSPIYYNSLGVFSVYKDGMLYYYTYDSKSLGVRPALIVPHDALFDAETMVLKGV